MGRFLLVILLAVSASAQGRGGRGGGAAAPVPLGPCERTCLDNLVDQYLDVLGFFMFNHPGDITWIKNADGIGTKWGTAATRPFSVDVAELFRIKDKQIRKVEALMVNLPYGQKNPFVPQQ